MSTRRCAACVQPPPLHANLHACMTCAPCALQDGFLRGHGTQMVDGKLVATLCGVVERVNKLVYVRPLKSRYTAEQGDVVIGRVTEVSTSVATHVCVLQRRTREALAFGDWGMGRGMGRHRDQGVVLCAHACMHACMPPP